MINYYHFHLFIKKRHCHLSRLFVISFDSKISATILFSITQQYVDYLRFLFTAKRIFFYSRLTHKETRYNDPMRFFAYWSFGQETNPMRKSNNPI